MKLDEMTMPTKDYVGEDLDFMSNLEHTVDKEIEARMRNEKIVTKYHAFNFFGFVWFQDNEFYCIPQRFHVCMGTWKAPTPEELMKELCMAFGDE